MKTNNIILSSAILALGGLMISCDNIDVNDRYIPVEKPNVSKVMLIQEFTGNMCTNCPQGANAIHTIQEAFPGQVIAVGLHPEGGGPNTEPIGDQDFRCEEAQVMYEYYKPSGFPCAVFNGTTKSTRFALWYSQVYDIFEEMNKLGEEAKMTISASTSYDASTRDLTVNYEIVPRVDSDTPMSVMVWIMENDILGYQLDNGTLLDNYIHNHVLRASMNGGWGETLPQLVNGDPITGTASMKLDSKWVAENCQVIVYVFQTDSKYVEQATLADV